MKDDSLYLADMLQRARRIEAFTRGGRDEFFASELIQDAVIRNFEVIGEAAARVSHELRSQYPDVAWRKVIGFRNVLIHGYTRLSLEEVQAIRSAYSPSRARVLDYLRAASTGSWSDWTSTELRTRFETSWRRVQCDRLTGGAVYTRCSSRERRVSHRPLTIWRGYGASWGMRSRSPTRISSKFWG